MLKIAPSILAADFVNLERDLGRLAAADYIHVDVMDGTFVPNFSIGTPVVEAIRRVTAVPLDVHLMIERPVRYVEAFAAAGADVITVHLEAGTREETLIALARIRACGKRAGLAVKPKTPMEELLPFLSQADLLLVMTIEPGFGGQPFLADRLPAVRQARRWIEQYNPACELEVDGGINPATAADAVKAGANVLVAGSFVFQPPHAPAKQIQRLRLC